MVITMNFGMLWSDGVDSGASSLFHIGIGEALPMAMVTIDVLWSYGGDSEARWTCVIHNGTVCIVESWC